MSELRQEVLQAEVAIRQLAEELARAKGIADSAEEVRRRLNEAATVLEQSRKALEEARASLKVALEAVSRASEQLNQSAQDLSSRVSQAITDFGERVRQTLQQDYQNMQAQLTAAIGEAQKALLNAANLITELRTGFESRVNTLAQQNEQVLQRIATQDAEIKRLSKLLTFCLTFSVTATATGIGIIALLLIRS